MHFRHFRIHACMFTVYTYDNAHRVHKIRQNGLQIPTHLHKLMVSVPTVGLGLTVRYSAAGLGYPSRVSSFAMLPRHYTGLLSHKGSSADPARSPFEVDGGYTGGCNGDYNGGHLPHG